MEATDESTPNAPKKRRGLRILLALLAAAACLYGLRLAVGLITGAIHYSRTPDFTEYVASHPVSRESLETRLPPGEVLSTESSWTTGSVDPLSLVPSEGEFVQAQLKVAIDINRGEQSLLQLKETFSLALRRSDWSHHGVHIAAETTTAPGLRAIVVTSLSDPESMIGDDSMAVGRAYVDVFLVSGEGPNECQFRLLPEDGAWGGAPVTVPGILDLPYWRMITGITHHVGSLPDEGLIHHVQQRVSFDWEKYENGHGGPAMFPVHHTVNTGEYSHEIRVVIEDTLNGGGSGKWEMTKNLRRSWKGETW